MWKSNLINKNISFIKSHFGSLFAITANGEVFSTSISREIGRTENEVYFEEIRLTVKEKEPCPHGIKFEDQIIVGVVDIDCSITTVFIVDLDGNVWTYPRENPTTDSDGNIQVSQIKFNRKVRSIYCGRFALQMF